MSNKSGKNFLRKIREQKNLTQEQLSKASGVTRYVISEFENEKHRPSPRTINKIAEALGCSYIMLMTGKEDVVNKKSASAEDRQKYLLESISLTQKFCINKQLDEELLMKISGYLSCVIEDYELASNDEKIKILEEMQEYKAKSIAYEIFINQRKK